MSLRNLFLLIVAGLLIGGGIVVISKNQPKKTQQINITDTGQPTIITTNMKLTSSAFAHNQPIPAKYTCDGQNINPPLAISDVPTNAKSLVLIVDDPDAPMGTWVHWTIWNIDPKTSEITEKSVPTGAIEGKTSFGDNKYGGPCPPSGTHRYFFKLYALDTTLSLSPSSMKEDLEKALTGHVLDKTELIGLYSRQ